MTKQRAQICPCYPDTAKAQLNHINAFKKRETNYVLKIPQTASLKNKMRHLKGPSYSLTCTCASRKKCKRFLTRSQPLDQKQLEQNNLSTG